MSSISWSRSLPEEWIVRANSTCLGLRLPSRLSASSFARISRLFNGVRSSCDMFAMNSDLYFDADDSCFARSSSSADPARSSWASRWDSASSASVRALASMVFTLTPMFSFSCSNRSRCTSVNSLRVASSITPSVSPWNSTGRMIRFAGVDEPSPDATVR